MLRVVSYNVHRAIGLDHRQDRERIGEILSALHADVITLQEVESAHGEQHPGQQLEQWAERLSMQYVAGPNMFHETAGYGNGVITRLNVERVQLHNISVERLEPRGIIDLVLTYKGMPIRILSTHFGLKLWERHQQMSHLIGLLYRGRDATLPTILTGDFNEWRWISGFFKKLNQRMPLAAKGRTFPTRWPLLRLDQIWCSAEWSLMDRKVVVTPQTRVASDHLPIYADLMFRAEV
jgi:endonuclease/exonuclease/phosphatase family metal-dependent hydrolase